MHGVTTRCVASLEEDCWFPRVKQCERLSSGEPMQRFTSLSNEACANQGRRREGIPFPASQFCSVSTVIFKAHANCAWLNPKRRLASTKLNESAWFPVANVCPDHGSFLGSRVRRCLASAGREHHRRSGVANGVVISLAAMQKVYGKTVRAS